MIEPERIVIRINEPIPDSEVYNLRAEKYYGSVHDYLRALNALEAIHKRVIELDKEQASSE